MDRSTGSEYLAGRTCCALRLAWGLSALDVTRSYHREVAEPWHEDDFLGTLLVLVEDVGVFLPEPDGD